MARQCWDEARHAEIMVRRIEATGVPWQPGEPGLPPTPWTTAPGRTSTPAGSSSAWWRWIRGIEGLSLDTHLYRFDTFAGPGDEVGAASHLYIVADEAPTSASAPAGYATSSSGRPSPARPTWP